MDPFKIVTSTRVLPKTDALREREKRLKEDIRREVGHGIATDEKLVSVEQTQADDPFLKKFEARAFVINMEEFEEIDSEEELLEFARTLANSISAMKRRDL